ncbi:MAG: hypothetical protein GY708_01760 [Actinomycetia bacterium]|nr:hypothetical protein [Actinomycetes bacterium]MCP4960970.1 hypothetical protein [Actinomycetes bacterium]
MSRRRPTHDRTGKILPLRVRQPGAYWTILIVSVLMILSLVGSAVALLFS